MLKAPLKICIEKQTNTSERDAAGQGDGTDVFVCYLNYLPKKF